MPGCNKVQKGRMNDFPLTIRNGTNKRGKINDFIGINFEFCAFCRNFAPYL
jgi:hypothetical protein